MTTLLEAARENLERSITWIDEHGWIPGSGYSETGGRCLVNTMGHVATTVEVHGLGEFIHGEVAAVVRDLEPCARIEPGDGGAIIHFNDEHCTGPDQAKEILASALKSVIGRLENAACAPGHSTVGS